MKRDRDEYESGLQEPAPKRTRSRTLYVTPQDIQMVTQTEVDLYLTNRYKVVKDFGEIIHKYAFPVSDRYDEITRLAREYDEDEVFEHEDHDEIYDEIDIHTYLPEDTDFYDNYVRVYLGSLERDLQKAQRGFLNPNVDEYAKSLHPQATTTVEDGYLVKKHRGDPMYSEEDMSSDSEASSSSHSEDELYGGDEPIMNDDYLLFEEQIIQSNDQNDIKWIKELNLKNLKLNPVFRLVEVILQHNESTLQQGPSSPSNSTINTETHNKQEELSEETENNIVQEFTQPSPSHDEEESESESSDDEEEFKPMSNLLLSNYIKLVQIIIRELTTFYKNEPNQRLQNMYSKIIPRAILCECSKEPIDEDDADFWWKSEEESNDEEFDFEEETHSDDEELVHVSLPNQQQQPPVPLTNNNNPSITPLVVNNNQDNDDDDELDEEEEEQENSYDPIDDPEWTHDPIQHSNQLPEEEENSFYSTIKNKTLTCNEHISEKYFSNQDGTPMVHQSSDLFCCEQDDRKWYKFRSPFSFEHYGPSDNYEYESLSVMEGRVDDEWVDPDSMHIDLIKMCRRFGIMNMSQTALCDLLHEMRMFIHGVMDGIVTHEEEEMECPSNVIRVEQVVRVCQEKYNVLVTPSCLNEGEQNDVNDDLISCCDDSSPCLLSPFTFHVVNDSSECNDFDTNMFWLIESQNCVFVVLKCMVVIKCPQLHSMLVSNSPELSLLKKVTSNVLKSFFEYLYTGDDEYLGGTIDHEMKILLDTFECDFDERGLFCLFDSDQYCNVLIQCSDGEIRSNQFLLMATCGFFEAMFESKLQCSDRVDLTEFCSVGTFRLLLEHLYGSSVTIKTIDTGLELIRLCDYLIVKGGFSVYCQLIVSQLITLDNILIILESCSPKTMRLFSYVEVFVSHHLDDLNLSGIMNEQQLKYYTLLRDCVDANNVVDRLVWSQNVVKEGAAFKDYMVCRLEDYWIPQYKDFIMHNLRSIANRDQIPKYWIYDEEYLGSIYVR